MRRANRTPRLPALALAAALAAGCAAAPEVGPVEGGLRPPPASPNGLSTMAPDGPPPLAFEGDPAAAKARLLAYLEAEERARVETVDGWYVHAVFTTPTLGFEDDVELLVAPEEGVVHVRSASRVGWWDLGANARRLERIRERW